MTSDANLPDNSANTGPGRLVIMRPSTRRTGIISAPVPDAKLAALGFSRVHHRILYFVGRNPRLGVNGLLRILGVTKQYLNKPLRQLAEKDYLLAVQDEKDRRVKRIVLTKSGRRLERELSGEQRRRFAEVFAEAGGKAESAWRKVMKLLADPRFD